MVHSSILLLFVEPALAAESLRERYKKLDQGHLGMSDPLFLDMQVSLAPTLPFVRPFMMFSDFHSVSVFETTVVSDGLGRVV